MEVRRKEIFLIAWSFMLSVSLFSKSSLRGLRVFVVNLFSRLRFLDQLAELIEKVGSVMWPRRSLGMVLHTEHRMVSVAQTFNRAVVQVDVGYFHVGG